MIATSNFRSLARREKLFLGAGAAAVIAFVYTMLPGGEEEPQASVELSAAPPAVTSAPAPAPAPATAPTPQVSAASTEGLVLTGLFGGGPRGGAAIFRLGSGQERWVPVGREVVPGLVLKSVGVSHAILGGAGGDMRFEIGRSGAAAGQVAAALPKASAGEADLQRETIQYRLGLQPVQAAGRVAGYALKPGAEMPRLRQAGLQPGDVITGVNGSRFDEERMMEFAWQAANSSDVQIEFVRNGRKMKANIRNGQ